MPGEEKLKFKPEEENFSLVLKVEFSSHKPQFSVTLSTKMNFFSSSSIFLREATKDDHIRQLYQFKQCTKFFGCLGSCGYVPPTVKSSSSTLKW